MINVRLFPSDETGCGHYRMIYPGSAVRESSDAFDVQYVFDDTDDGALELQLIGRQSGATRLVGVLDPQCDVVVLQRPATRQLAEAIPFIQAYGTAVVCDFDDDFDSLDKRNPAYQAYNSEWQTDINAGWARLAASYADLVTVTTPALARRYGTHGRYVILPNYVPEAHLGAKPLPGWERNHLKIGYAGNPQIHPGDLEVTRDAIPRTLGAHESVGFLAIGGKGVLDNLGLEESGNVEVMDFVGIGVYPNALATFDVGIVPLADTAFNRAKSWLKGLEYAAAGVPFVASPTQQYRELELLGVGRTVREAGRSRNAWVEALTPLLEDATLRNMLAEEGLIQAATMTYERNAHRWMQAWSDALTVRRAA